ncbi:hypothetical protein E1262_25535 [Jiangella aurantiaca]|uniref:Alpha/beta hydrolase n=1 Tax=Jiangella aurantiaca TaxID=2530373 RepID=A0A4R5A3B4_9ACTN|nr:hypothetical protein [Jiangella aurantiaca]TDD65336.1 hypothetical protein E1262_25535 [Jiangella aurantiaca]
MTGRLAPRAARRRAPRGDALLRIGACDVGRHVTPDLDDRFRAAAFQTTPDVMQVSPLEPPRLDNDRAGKRGHEADTPTRYLLLRHDRMFPAAWARRHARQRIGIDPDEMDGGHYAALSRAHELADRLTAYAVGAR